MMQRRHYEFVAQAIAEARADMVDHPARLAGSAQVARTLARALRADNPRFDRDRFLEACGITQT